MAQERQVFRWVNGKDPRQYGFDFALWTRKVVAALIEREFGVKLGLTAVGKLLAKLGLTPQKPLQRAYQRDPEAIARWQHEIYPRLAADASARRADCFWDDQAFAPMRCGSAWGVPNAGRPFPGSANRCQPPRQSMPQRLLVCRPTRRPQHGTVCRLSPALMTSQKPLC
jgi:hypothetical protein